MKYLSSAYFSVEGLLQCHILSWRVAWILISHLILGVKATKCNSLDKDSWSLSLIPKPPSQIISMLWSGNKTQQSTVSLQEVSFAHLRLNIKTELNVLFLNFLSPFLAYNTRGSKPLQNISCRQPLFKNITPTLKGACLFNVYIPGCVPGGANWAVANNHNVMLTTELQKLGLCEIWIAFNLQVSKKKKKQNKSSYKLGQIKLHLPSVLSSSTVISS